MDDLFRSALRSSAKPLEEENMKDKMPFNFYLFRFLTLIILISLFFIVPGKSVIFDNWVNFSRALIGGSLIFLAHYLWNYYKKDQG